MPHNSQSSARTRAAIAAVAAATVILVIVMANSGSAPATDPLAGEGDIAAGEVAFEATCAVCHGIGGIGTDLGPPLVDQIYRPGHHGDGAFFAAVRIGARQHHWRFGNMPAQEGLTNEDINNIVAYVRQLQIEAGIQ